MVRQRLVFSILLVLLTAAAASANTVEYVSLEVTSDPTRARFSYEHEVHDGRIQGFRMPFIKGQTHRVTIIGHLTDFLQKVQIVVDGEIVRTIWKSGLISVGHTDEHGGKGKIVFRVRPEDLPAVGSSFQIRIRFANEIAGFDKLDCKVARRGKIQRVDWATENDAQLPEFNTNAQGNPRDYIRLNRTYTLNFSCYQCPSSVQFYDGVTEELLDQPVSGSSLEVSGSLEERKLSATFTMRDSIIGGDVRPLVRFADSGIGNISGGWGNYVYSRIEEQELPGRNAANPNRTNLQRVFLGQPPPPPGTFRIRTNGTGWGWVISEPSGISCPSFCTQVFDPHTNVQFSAVARADSKFMGWSQGCSGTGQCLIDNGNNTSRFNVTATFALNFVLDVNIIGVGTVTGANGQISCPSTSCRAESQTRNARMILTAQAGPGKTFLEWSGAEGCSDQPQCSVQLNNPNQTVTARFTP